MRENFLSNDAAQRGLNSRALVMALDMVAGVFEEVAIFDATGANGFTRAAAKTEVQMAHRRIGQSQLALLNCAHQIDAATRRVVFVAGFQVSGASSQTESAMN